MPQAPDKVVEKYVTVIVDRKPVKSERTTTVGEVLVAAHLDPSRRQLVQVQGKHQTPYPDVTAKLTLHEGEIFVTVSTGPTPVS